MKCRVFLLFFLVLQIDVFGALNEDSLLVVIKTSKVDTSVIKALNHLSNQLYLRGDYKNSLTYSKDAIEKAKKLGLKKFLAQALSVSGTVYSQNGNPDIALKFYNESLKLYEELKDQKGRLKLIYFMGLLYVSAAQYEKAIECNFKSIALEKSGKDTSEIARRYLSTGYTYYKMDDHKKALHYTLAALRATAYKKDIGLLASVHNQFGLVYTNLKDFDRAFKEFDTALALYTEAKLFKKISNVYNNIGNIYADKKDYQKAVENYQKGLKLYKDAGDNYNYTLANFNLGLVYRNMGELKKAKAIMVACEKEGRENNMYDLLVEVYKELYHIYKESGDCEKSFENYVQSARYKDTIAGEEIKNSVLRSEMKHEFELTQIADSIALSKEREVVAVKFEQERSTRIFLYIGLGLVLITTFFIVRNLIQSKRTNKIITLQKQEVEQQKKLVDVKNIMIEEKQREIIDSINYAKRIQNSIIASDDMLHENLKEFFVMFMPKDIVSGDFYWATKHDDKFYLAVCDSTGHGVPGAFMSLLNIGFLSETINEKNILEPNAIFDRVRERLVSTISKDGQQDGFDGVLVCFDQKTNKVTYASAHNSPLLIRDGKIKELEKDKMPVGKSPRDREPFTLHTIELQKGDCLYLYTDGYPDQFGGPQGKKFRYRKLEELLRNHQHLSCEQQKGLLKDTIENWKGELEQVDDILVFGIKV